MSEREGWYFIRGMSPANGKGRMIRESTAAVPERGVIPIPRALTLKLIRQHYLPVSERTYYRWMAEKKFPEPDLRDGEKLQFWQRDTIEAWFAEYVRTHSARRDV